MKRLKKALNAEQREFESLMNVMQWSQADTSRNMKLSRSAVSQILSGKNTPSSQTLQLLRRIVMDAERERASGASEIRAVDQPKTKTEPQTVNIEFTVGRSIAEALAREAEREMRPLENLLTFICIQYLRRRDRERKGED